MEAFIDWLSRLPHLALYLIMGGMAAVENLFPPLPADVVVAFGSWLAARGKGSVLLAFLFSWVGNTGGAAAMYFMGRRHGAGWIQKRFPKLADERAEKRLKAWYAKYGIAALVLSRFIPGVRALVPPFAGALHVPPTLALGAIALASGVWYGIVSYLGFTAGADWNQAMAVIRRYGLITALAAAGILLVGALVWLVRRKRAKP